MAYSQWIKMNISPENFSVKIKNLSIGWGKFHNPADKDEEINIENINNYVVKEGETYIIASCGREDASSGTTGSFDLFDEDIKIGHYSWDCPWGSKKNTSEWNRENNKYIVDVSGANYDGGAIGTVSFDLYKKG
ncbi:hypothetical protein CBG25_17190 [Arsenophonus sp. ENCA]|uniref:aegerolysin family protein n=1 Tax=Arsenophonus sp. ENCA TaxID=1987579 RepID=UPI000BD5F419|nr:aegerolysin family protein [Arsenophonus sp. ENCA]PAV01349.1 hypothetical protein CBG25_17190 [Arsenophonus sp. ENCA]